MERIKLPISQWMMNKFESAGVKRSVLQDYEVDKNKDIESELREVDIRTPFELEDK